MSGLSAGEQAPRSFAPDRYAVIGNPVAHSKSPTIHRAFAMATGERLEYEALLAPLDGFAQSAQRFAAQGGRGANVTVPFKLDAYRYANELSARAAAAGAVNTLRFDGSRVFGDNTDGIGLVRDIEQNLALPLTGKRVLLLGAGGAARGVLLPLIEARAAEIVIVNRTAPRALELQARFEASARANRVGLLARVALEAGARFDIVINATASSLKQEMPPCGETVFGPGVLAYDMMYGTRPSLFMERAQACGARAVDGLGMLVEQAAESFAVWRGVRPAAAEIHTVLAALRASLLPQ